MTGTKCAPGAPDEGSKGHRLGNSRSEIEDSHSQSLASKVFQGAGILIVSRVISRLLGILSILTVARWLGPEEVGVFGVGMLVLSAVEQLSETGLRPALIQRRGDIDRYIAPVRTVQAVRGFLLGLLVFTTAPWTAGFLGSPKSVEILRIIAFVPAIQGLEPIFETLSRRELRFGSVVKVQVGSSIFGLLVALISACLKPDAWALVYAALARATASTMGYYAVSRRQLWHFSLSWGSLKQLHSFGFWVFLTGIASYLFLKGGDWAIGRMLTIQELAIYQMAFLITTTITGELSGMLNTMLLPMFSRVQSDMVRLRRLFDYSFGTISITTFLMASLVCACSPDFYMLFLGPRWTPALPLVPWLAAWGVCSVLGALLGSLVQALGRPDLWTGTVFLMVGLMAVLVCPLTARYGSTGVAVLLGTIGVFMQLLRYWIVARLLHCRYSLVVRHVFVPLTACVVAVTAMRGVMTNAFGTANWFSFLLNAVGTTAIFGLIVGFSGARFQPSIKELLGWLKRVVRGVGRPVIVFDQST